VAIYGAIDDIIKQAELDPGIQAGLRYLKGLAGDFLADKPLGYSAKTIIRGKGIFAMHQVYETKPVRQARFEAHRKYIDLQYIWEGAELIAVAPLDSLTTIVPYSRCKDIEFFRYFPSTSLVMGPGVLALLFPCDAHAPCLVFKRRQIVRKTVVKILNRDRHLFFSCHPRESGDPEKGTIK
jgi:biofilm protein TabA